VIDLNSSFTNPWISFGSINYSPAPQIFFQDALNFSPHVSSGLRFSFYLTDLL
jgi:hypothetical protein